MTKKSYTTAGVASLLAAVTLFGAGTFAMAQTTPAPSSAPSVMSLEVGQKGEVSLIGTVDSVGTGTLSVKSWGGTWTVNVSSATVVTPKGTTATDLSGIKVGDTVGVHGTISTAGFWTIDAKNLRDKTTSLAGKPVKQNHGGEKGKNEKEWKGPKTTGTTGVTGN